MEFLIDSYRSDCYRSDNYRTPVPLQQEPGVMTHSITTEKWSDLTWNFCKLEENNGLKTYV